MCVYMCVYVRTRVPMYLCVRMHVCFSVCQEEHPWLQLPCLTVHHCVLRELKAILISSAQYNLKGNSTAAVLKKKKITESNPNALAFFFFHL